MFSGTRSARKCSHSFVLVPPRHPNSNAHALVPLQANLEVTRSEKPNKNPDDPTAAKGEIKEPGRNLRTSREAEGTGTKSEAPCVSARRTLFLRLWCSRVQLRLHRIPDRSNVPNDSGNDETISETISERQPSFASIRPLLNPHGFLLTKINVCPAQSHRQSLLHLNSQGAAALAAKAHQTECANSGFGTSCAGRS